MAQLYFRDGLYEKAVNLALKDENPDIPVMYVIAIGSRLMGNNDRSIDYYARILSQDENQAEAKLGIGIAYKSKGDFSKALGYLRDYNSTHADDEVKKELSQIIIEGHTDDVGSYIYNMELSQKRAFEVIKYIYDEMPNFKGKEELKSYITANGRSNIKVLRDNSGNIDRDKSRRVEFQFKLKEDETLMKIEKTLKEGN